MLPSSYCLLLLALTFVPGRVVCETKVVCEGETVSMNCPPGHVVNIIAANYGRQDKINCPKEPMKSTTCSLPHTANVISARCYNLQDCFVQATNNIFGDPCPGTIKYLQVSYECVKRDDSTDSAPPSGGETLTCEDDLLTLGCPEGKVIKIISANYGREERITCPKEPMNSTDCHQPKSDVIVASKCENKQNCAMYSSNVEFGDPCPWTIKYLTTKYECVDRVVEQPGSTGILPTTEIVCENEYAIMSCPAGYVVSVVAANYGRSEASICPRQNDPNTACFAPHTANIIAARCYNLQMCIVQGSNYIFGDPCAGTIKYLQVNYECVKRDPDDALTPSGGDALTCEGDVLSLGCPEGKVIRIVSANYGRTDSTTCPRQPMNSTNCHQPQSKVIVASKCDNKQNCLMPASNDEFGDPCPWTIKYLVAKYECIPRSTRHRPAGNALVCEGDFLILECEPGRVIEVTKATYGRKNLWTCPRQPMQSTTCGAPHSTGLLIIMCNNKQSCVVPASNRVFGDPCPGTKKYLEASYKCIKKGGIEPELPPVAPITPATPAKGGSTTVGKDGKVVKSVCQNERLTLECPSGKFLLIHTASYGRSDRSTCNYGPVGTISCSAKDSHNIVFNRCDGHHACTVYAESDLFGDPCPDTFKYLTVTYECI